MRKIIFIVEDNDDIREMLEYLLVSEGYQVNAFANIASLKAQINQGHPHLIVLDVMLPDGNGVDVSMQLKSNRSTQHIPILLMSANTNAAYMSNVSGADDFINKPFDIDEFMQKVKRIAAT